MTTPRFQITVDGVDRTAAFNDRMLELEVTDHDGGQADEFKATFDDRDFALAPPSKGASVVIKMDDGRGRGLQDMGTFEVRGRHRKFSKDQGRTLSITGKSADIGKSIKQPRTGKHEKTTYEGLFNTVAGRNGLSAKVSPSIAGIVVDYEAQAEESDLHLASRLARDVHAIVKVAKKQMILRARDDLDMQPIALAMSDFIGNCEVADDDRAQHGKVHAHHHDQATAQRIRQTYTNDDPNQNPDAPDFTLRHALPSADRAKAAAKGKMRQLQAKEKGLHGELSGNTAVMGGLPVIIAWGVEMYDGTYVVKTARHKMVKDGGYSTTIDCEKGKDGGA